MEKPGHLLHRKRLGKGLDSLFSAATPSPVDPRGKETLRWIDPAGIEPNPYQPRRDFPTVELEELKQSIAEKGLLQPLVVRATSIGFQLIAGERRLRASKELGLERVPAIVREASDEDLLEMALIENLQRQDLNPIEKALAFRQLVDVFGLTHDAAAARIGKDRSSVTNYLRLLDLPTPVRELVAGGDLSMGHARALLTLPTCEEQARAAQAVVQDRLSVRETERRFAAPGPKRIERKKRATRLGPEVDPGAAEWEREFEQALATKVRVVPRGQGGTITIEFYSNEQFCALRDRLMALPAPSA